MHHVHHTEAVAKVLERVIDNTFNHPKAAQAQHWFKSPEWHYNMSVRLSVYLVISRTF